MSNLTVTVPFPSIVPFYHCESSRIKIKNDGARLQSLLSARVSTIEGTELRG